jgi:hypothetical protein
MEELIRVFISLGLGRRASFWLVTDKLPGDILLEYVAVKIYVPTRTQE